LFDTIPAKEEHIKLEHVEHKQPSGVGWLSKIIICYILEESYLLIIFLGFFINKLWQTDDHYYNFVWLSL
jgi:hypothetical protein